MCQEEFSFKTPVFQIISNHKSIKMKEVAERDIAKELTFYNTGNRVVGETLTESTPVFCVKVALTFLCASILINKLDFLFYIVLLLYSDQH